MARQVGYRSNSNWEEMMKWWSLAHSDGSHSPPDVEGSKEEKKEFSKEDRVPFVDDVDRVYEIAFLLKRIRGRSFEKNGYTSAHIQGWLCELLKYVESVDIGYEIHSKGGLVALLKLLYYTEAGIRAKAAEVITAMLQNNPSSQHLVMKTRGCLNPLFYNFYSDPDATARTNTLAAISSLIRNNEPGITAFRRASGYEVLRDALKDDALSSESVRFQREALNLIQYLLHQNSSDCNIVTELRFPCIMMHLASSDDAEVREAALRCLLVLARDEEGGNSDQLVKNDDKLKQVLQELIEGISVMASEDLGAAREEKQLLDSLWNACYT